MLSEQGESGETTPTPEQQEPMMRIRTSDGQIRIVPLSQLSPLAQPEPEKEKKPSLISPTPEPTIEPKETIDDENIRELTTQIIAFNVDNYDELNVLGGVSLDELEKMSPEERAAKEAEMQERFNAPARRFFEELVVHGATRGEHYFGVDAATDNPIIFNTTDLDGRGAVGLMAMAGVDVSRLEYVKKGDKIEGKVNLDTGNHWGLAVALPEGAKGLSPEEIKRRNLKATIFIDHHGPEAKRGYSATKGVYETLVRLGMLEKTEVLDRTVEFITRQDNGVFPFEDYEKSDKILAGLTEGLKLRGSRHEDGSYTPGLINFMLYSIDHNKSLEEMAKFELDEEEIKKFGLERESAKKKEEIIDSQIALKEDEEEGSIAESPEYGRIVFDYEGHVKGGWEAIKCPGILGQPADVLIQWYPRTNGFFISASRDFDEKTAEILKKQGAEIIRGNMAVKPAEYRPARTTINVAEIFQSMGVTLSELKKSETRAGRFNTRGLFNAVQKEEENQNINIYGIARPPGQRR